MLFRSVASLRLHGYLRVTSVLLLVVAGGLLASGVDGLGELGYLPALPGPLDPGALPVGAALRIAAGFEPRTSLLSVLTAVAYLSAVLWALRCAAQARVAAVAEDRRRSRLAGPARHTGSA